MAASLSRTVPVHAPPLVVLSCISCCCCCCYYSTATTSSPADAVPRVRQTGFSPRLLLSGAVHQGRPPILSQGRALPAGPHPARAAVEGCVGGKVPGGRLGTGMFVLLYLQGWLIQYNPKNVFSTLSIILLDPSPCLYLKKYFLSVVDVVFILTLRYGRYFSLFLRLVASLAVRCIPCFVVLAVDGAWLFGFA